MAKPRLFDSGYLNFLRARFCVACGKPPPCEAAHIRIGFFAMGKKPDDKFAVPLCPSCHREQHSMNETEFWNQRGMDPFAIAAQLYKEYGGTGGAPRKKRKSRAGPKPTFTIKWPKRKIRNRGFSRVRSV